MKLIVGGCRGTSPVAQAEFMKYGGETTSFLIEGEAGERVIVDAGTGVRGLGERLERQGDVASLLMLYSHYHLDHVSGLPSLQLIYSPRWSIEMAAPNRGAYSIREVIPRLMHKPFWPLQVEDLGSRIKFTTLRGSMSRTPRTFGGLKIRWCAVHHPDGCTAYRIDEPATGTSCVIATDMEWGLSSDAERANFLTLCREPDPVSLLVMDGQHSKEEYPTFKGWGHSTWPDCIDVARACGVKKLIVTHHAPLKNDVQLAVRDAEIQNAWKQARLARESSEVVVGAP